MLRIIAGVHKKQRIDPPKGMKERPTTDRAKEGLFNIILNRFDPEGIEVLDLFAGTGSISFEFCSRGCERITSVEKDPRLSSFIERTALQLGMKGLRVVKGDAMKYLERCQTSHDLIFADPPYGEHETYHRIIGSVREGRALKKGGWLILEHDADLNFEGEKGHERTCKFGKSRFSIFVRSGRRNLTFEGG